jgi:hypothetical protein
MTHGNRWKPGVSRMTLALVAFVLPLQFFLSDASSAADPQGLAPLQEYVKTVGKARYEDYAKKEGVVVKNVAEFDKMKKHVTSLYEGVKVKNSFVLGERDHIDCVDVNTQPSLRRGGKFLPLAKPPAPMIAGEKQRDETREGSPVEPMLSAKKKDAYGNVQHCEDGFVPMRRVTLEELVRYETLADFFNKYGKAGEKGIPHRK